MVKLPSALNVVQSYLAWIPVSAELVSFAAREEKRGFFSPKPDVVVVGKLGKEKREILLDPAGLLSDFANTHSDPSGVLLFTRKRGVLHRGEIKYYRQVDEIGDRFHVPCARWLDRQREFRDQWTRGGKAHEEYAKIFADRINPASRTAPAVKAYVVPGKKGQYQLELRPDDLLGALWLALLVYSGRTRKCQNPTCSSPYFIASRKDQKYCNEVCSRLVANRKWWANKGAQWRKNRLKNGRRNSR